jgi:meso-butanediol dehydrogenase / (S,S)-butanediol dehydrogenase / diacetyl reductase
VIEPKQLKGKVAIVTGAGAGIGRASAMLFAREGAHVVCVDRDESSVRHLEKEITAAGGSASASVADVSASVETVRVIAETIAQRGTINILFNVAGIVPHGKIHETPEAEWDRCMAVNAKSVYLWCHEVVPQFLKQGGGVILNTASATVLRNVSDRACYSASKAAVLALSKSMAFDYVKQNIRVNCLCPGTIDTPSLHGRLQAFSDPEEARRNFIARQPMGRFGTAEEVAEAALYLVSDKAAFVTGVAFSIDGGFAL